MNIEARHSIVIESPPRTAIRVSRERGRIVLRQGGTSWISMTDEELDAILDAVEKLSSPQLGKLWSSNE